MRDFWGVWVDGYVKSLWHNANARTMVDHPIDCGPHFDKRLPAANLRRFAQHAMYATNHGSDTSFIIINIISLARGVSGRFWSIRKRAHYLTMLDTHKRVQKTLAHDWIRLIRQDDVHVLRTKECGVEPLGFVYTIRRNGQNVSWCLSQYVSALSRQDHTIVFNWIMKPFRCLEIMILSAEHHSSQ